jgi:hypothetical protein
MIGRIFQPRERPMPNDDETERETADGTPARSTARAGRANPVRATQADRQAATVRYLDRPEIGETFADCVTGLLFEGHMLRLEFGVTRLDEVKPNTPITGRRYPVCRLVLPPSAAVELINRMQQIAAALSQAGMVKSNPQGQPPAGTTPQSN